MSQRLRRFRQIPAELIPLGPSPSRKTLSRFRLCRGLHSIRYRRWIRRLCRRLLMHAPFDGRQDHPSQASEPCRGQHRPRGLRRAPLRNDCDKAWIGLRTCRRSNCCDCILRGQGTASTTNGQAARLPDIEFTASIPRDRSELILLPHSPKRRPSEIMLIGYHFMATITV